MVSKERIKNQAVMMGIETGEMPEVEYIWEVQRFDGQESCFGQGLGCVKMGCRWRQSCLALSLGADRGRDSGKTNREQRFSNQYISRKAILQYPSLTEDSLGKNG